MAGAAVKDAFVIDENENVFTSCLSEVDRHASFLTAFEDEVIGAEHSFLEPDCGRDLVGAHLGFSSFNFPKCFSVDNFSCTFEDDDITIDSDAVDSIPNVGDQKNIDNLEGMLQGMGETVLGGPKCQLTSCMEYFLDDESACGNPSLIYDTSGNYQDTNSGLDDKSFGIVGRDSGAAILRLSSENVVNAMPKNDQNSALPDKLALQEFQSTCRNVLEQDTIVKDEQWLRQCLTFGFSNSTQLDGSSNLMRSESDMTSFEDEVGLSRRNSSGRNLSDEIKVDVETVGIGSDSPSLSSSVVSEIGVDFQDKGDVTGPPVTGKRVHKPPRRYIEELLDVKSRYNHKKFGTSDRSSKPKCLSRRVNKQESEKGNVVGHSADQAGSFNGACIQVPFGLPVEEEDIKDIYCLGRQPDSSPRNQRILLNERSLPIFPKKERSDPEYLSTDLQHVLEDDHVRSIIQKSRRRRKHHMPWTLSEVMNLIEGVSRVGIGKWSKIKRLLFSSSKHRTSVDLKDKWRNLVKASCTQLRRRRKVLQGRKQLSHQAPESVLRRVRELSNFYT